MNIEKIFDEKIKNILEKEKVLSILLIGAGARVEKKDFHTLRDIDLFVITNEKYEFERELTTIEGLLFDISFMSLGAFKKAIKDGIPFLINSLQTYKIVYNINKDLEELLNEIEYLYKKGPKRLDSEEINYIRFKLYQDFIDILSRKEEHNIAFLMHNLFLNTLTAYFKLNGYWKPKDKKMLNKLQKVDEILYNLSIEFLKDEELNKRLDRLNNIINYVLEPYGGALELWERGRFPLV